MKHRRPATPRPISTIARAERDGVVMCPDVLVVIHGRPGTLGSDPRTDITAWFYGALKPELHRELEDVADAARGGEEAPAGVFIDLVLQTPGGGELRLDDCRLGLPVRYAGPASTLEYRVSHAGTMPVQLLRAA